MQDDVIADPIVSFFYPAVGVKRLQSHERN